MKYSLLFIQVLFVTFLLSVNISFAQESERSLSNEEITGGTVQYEQFTKYDLSVFGNNPKVKEWLAGMPRGDKSAKILYFNPNYSLYEEDISVNNIPLDAKMQVMKEKMAYVQPPKPELKRVFINLDKNIKTEQVELMTRFFLIENEIESQAWKPGINQRKIQGYICMDATMKRGEETITAWFTPKIPISFGPDNYRGLPGLILAVDINGENVILATSVDLTPPPDDSISRPKDGKKIKQEAFDKIVAEKIDEFAKAQKSKSAVKRKPLGEGKKY
jgi:GLPGLI family protein